MIRKRYKSLGENAELRLRERRFIKCVSVDSQVFPRTSRRIREVLLQLFGRSNYVRVGREWLEDGVR